MEYIFDIFKIIHMHTAIRIVPKDIGEVSMHNIKLNPIRIKYGKYRGLLLFHQLCFFSPSRFIILVYVMAFSVDRFPTDFSIVDDKTK